MFVQKLLMILTALWYVIDQNLANKDVFSKFFQNDYSIKNDRITCNDYNKEFLQDFQILQYKYNRSTSAVNVSVLSNVDITRKNTVVTCQVYKRYGNEFKYFPIRFAISVCQALELNLLGLGTYSCGKLSCPVKKNVRQSVCNWRPDFSRMPPFLPDGEYVAKFNITYDDQYLIDYDYFMTVYRKVKIPS